jgi:hypothetical protein
MEFTQLGGGFYSNCNEAWDYGKSVKLDQNLDNIQGKTSLPNVTVSWEHKESGGIA